MEAIRKIVNANILSPVIDLPWKSKDMQVEVIVIPLDKAISHRTATGKSLKGCLKKYANPALLLCNLQSAGGGQVLSYFVFLYIYASTKMARKYRVRRRTRYFNYFQES